MSNGTDACAYPSDDSRGAIIYPKFLFVFFFALSVLLQPAWAQQQKDEQTDAESETPAELDAISVLGWRPSDTLGYLADTLSSATKTENRLHDTAMSISVITEDLIIDQNALSLDEALRNVAGVGVGPNAANVSVQEEFTIRGFESALVRLNGVQRRSTGPLSTANIESIEVIKGPMSVLYGDLSPGGFINVQTKRPGPEAAAEFRTSLSTVAPGRGTTAYGSMDLTGPVTEDGQWLYRLIASGQGGNQFIDTADREQYFVAPSLSFIGADRRLRTDLDLTYLRNDETFQFGIPARGDRPDRRLDIDTFLGSTDGGKETEDYGAELRTRYQLSDSTQIDAALTWHLNEHFSIALRPFGTAGAQVADDDTIRRSFSLRSFETSDTQFEANLIHEFGWGSTEWRLLAGFDVRRTEVDHSGPGFGNIINFDRANVFAPDRSVQLPSADSDLISFFDRVDQTSDTVGGYVQAESWLTDRLRLVAGLRYSELEYTFADTSGFTFTEKPDSVDPRVGLLYKLGQDTSVYASYSSSFEQSFSFDPDNVEPLEAEQIELGLKHEWFDGRAMLTVSLFELTQKNLSTTDPETGFNRQIGEAESRGVEIEVRGRVIRGLTVSGSYSYLDNEISKDNDGAQGNRLPNVPQEEASIWLNYEAGVHTGLPLTLSAGWFYEGERFTSANNGLRLPGYATADASVAYRFSESERPAELRAGVKNIFDREYFVSGFGEGIAFPGRPRTVFVQLVYGF